VTHDAPITPLRFLTAFEVGIVLGLLLVIAIHAIKPGSRTLVFGSLVLAGLAYVPFAVAGNAGPTWVAIEVIGAILYAAVAVPALGGSMNWLIAAWALHPMWDVAVHILGPGRTFVNPYAWPIPCISFDLVVAGYMAYVGSRDHSIHRRALARR
jgi:hypothetical protein